MHDLIIITFGTESLHIIKIVHLKAENDGSFYQRISYPEEEE